VNPPRRLAALLLVLTLLAGLYSLAIPIFEGPDEIWHFAVADHLADGGGLPVVDPGSPNLLLRNGLHPPLYYWPIAALIAGIDRSDFPSAFRFNLASPRITPGSTSDRPNLLIHTAREDFPFRQTPLAVHLGRLFSIALGALTVYFIWAAARRIVPGLAFWSAALAAGVPQFVYGLGVINNDALAAAAAALTLLALLALMQTHATRWALAAGLGLGLALLSKVGLIVLLPLPAIALGLGLIHEHHRANGSSPLWPSSDRGGGAEGGGHRALRSILLHLLLIYALAALLSGWWYLRNWRLYGDPLAWREWKVFAGAGRPPPTLAGFASDLLGLFGTFWADFGLRLDRAWVWAFLILAVLAALGWGRRLLRRDWPQVYWPGLALALAAFALLLVSALRYALVITEIHGRLLHPALTAAGVTLALGLTGLGPRLGRRLLAAAVVALWAISASVPFLVLRPAFARPVLASLPTAAMPASAEFGGLVALAGHASPPQRAQPGETILLRTYWRTIAPATSAQGVAPDLAAVVVLLRPDGVPLGRGEARLGTTLYPNSVWRAGDVVFTDIPVTLAPNPEAPALATVSLGVRALSTDLLPASTGGDSVPLGRVAVPVPAACDPAVPARADFGGQLRLDGYHLADGALTLCWTALAAPAADYTVFVHLLDPAGQPLGGADGPPVNGQYPTSAWLPGETVADRRPLRLPPGASLEIGLYLPASGERLPLTGTTSTALRLHP
jgi:hypothetical protein